MDKNKAELHVESNEVYFIEAPPVPVDILEIAEKVRKALEENAKIPRSLL